MRNCFKFIVFLLFQLILFEYNIIFSCSMADIPGSCGEASMPAPLQPPTFNLNNINTISPAGSISIINISNSYEFNFNININSLRNTPTGFGGNDQWTPVIDCASASIPVNSLIDQAINSGHDLKFVYQIYYHCLSTLPFPGEKDIFTNIPNVNGGLYDAPSFCVSAYLQYAIYDVDANSFLDINNGQAVNTISIFSNHYSYLLGSISSILFSIESQNVSLNAGTPQLTQVWPNPGQISAAVSTYPQQVLAINVPAPKVPTITSIPSLQAPSLIQYSGSGLQYGPSAPSAPNVGTATINAQSGAINNGPTYNFTFNFEIGYGKNSYNVVIHDFEVVDTAIAGSHKLIFVYQIYYNCQLGNFSENNGIHFKNITLPSQSYVLSSYGYGVNGFLQYAIYDTNINEYLPFTGENGYVNTLPIFSNVSDVDLGDMSFVIFSSKYFNSPSSININPVMSVVPFGLINRAMYFNTDMINYGTSIYPAQSIIINSYNPGPAGGGF